MSYVIIYLDKYIYKYLVGLFIYFIIFQIAGSVVRLLTNIPHCCTIRIGVFSDPMWPINLSVLATNINYLNKFNLNYIYSRYRYILKRN